MTIEKSMLLISSSNSWDSIKSFKMIPITVDCPYTAGMFNMNTKHLIVASKIKEPSHVMLPRLDDNGDVEFLKQGKRKPSYPGEEPKTYKESRKDTEQFVRYEIETKEEILAFIKMFAINADTFNIEPYFIVTSGGFDQAPLSTIDTIKEETPKIELVS